MEATRIKEDGNVIPPPMSLRIEIELPPNCNSQVTET